MAAELARWNPDLSLTGLRFSNVLDEGDYERFPEYDTDATLRRWNLWAYIDSRDGAQAVRKALERDTTGFDTFVIANADTVMSRSTTDLVAEQFPGVPTHRAFGENETLLCIDKARRILGYEPQFGWHRSGR